MAFWGHLGLRFEQRSISVPRSPTGNSWRFREDKEKERDTEYHGEREAERERQREKEREKERDTKRIREVERKEMLLLMTSKSQLFLFSSFPYNHQ